MIGRPRRKLRPADVRTILRISKTEPRAAIAARFGITPAHLSNIIAGKAWKRLTNPPRYLRRHSDARR